MDGRGHLQCEMAKPRLGAMQDVYKTAEAIRALGYEVTKEPGPLPGLGTKITASVDPDGWKVSTHLLQHV